MTLGSLFDGLGGWQLAAVRAGVKPVWSSEIDKFCCSITARHFPETIQLGDINFITDAPKVDIITAGSPCQNLSVSGNRSGLNGKQSSLFFKATELVRRINPKFFVRENVPGAFSSNGGNDFRTVLEEILQERVPLPRHWSNAGVVDGRRCQIAWRLLDAQYWGVAQRRKRIFLIADFATRRAGEILFERKSLSGDFTSSTGEEQDLAARTGNRTCSAIYDMTHADEVLRPVTGDKVNCLNSRMGTGGNQVPILNAHSSIRRLTPVECERLQGLPDDFTAGGSDTQRYKAIGNGMAQPCADWIIKRIKERSSCHTELGEHEHLKILAAKKLTKLSAAKGGANGTASTSLTTTTATSTASTRALWSTCVNKKCPAGLS